MTTSVFSSLPLSPEFLANLDSLGYTEMTPIQAQSLPVIFDGKDVKAQAKTGSGKTAAFGIGLLNKINPGLFQTQALVLCPTRELADQVSKELRRLARPIPNTKILTRAAAPRWVRSLPRWSIRPRWWWARQDGF